MVLMMMLLRTEERRGLINLCARMFDFWTCGSCNMLPRISHERAREVLSCFHFELCKLK